MADVSGDSNGAGDVFVFDLASSVLVRASVSPTGVEASGPSGGAPALSGDGRFVSFISSSLAGGSGTGEYVVKDLATGAIDRHGTNQLCPNADHEASFSDDGRFFAYCSGDVLVADRAAGTTAPFPRVVYPNHTPQPANPSLSADGTLLLRNQVASIVAGPVPLAAHVPPSTTCASPAGTGRDVAAYDPATDSWIPISNGPYRARMPQFGISHAVFTGTEVLFWGESEAARLGPIPPP